VQRAYDGDDRSSCSFGNPPPYIDFQVLGQLGTTFANTMNAACAPDGGRADAGTCLLSDGGTSACRVADKLQDAAVGTLRDVMVPVDVIMDVPQPPAEAGPDGPTCTIGPVWDEASRSFSLHAIGGLPPPGQSDGGCSSTSVSYFFWEQTRTLWRSGCFGGQTVNEEVSLVSAQIDAIRAAVAALRTTCRKDCGADAPDMTLFVKDCAGQSQGTYQSNFYAGCAGKTVNPPFIDFADLASFESVLEGILRASCDGADAGAGGTCRPLCRR
jgi:hypothetical protein